MSSFIPPNEHVFIAGRTGTGKTWLARKYAAGYKYTVVLDTKRTFKWPEVAENEVTIVERLRDIGEVTTSKIIYRPVWEEMNMQFYNRFFQWCYMRGNTVVLVDEIMQVCKNAGTIPDFMRAIYAQGRELNVAIWGCTQRPNTIPQMCISEASHLFIFELNLPKDREKIVDVSGYEEFNEKPGQYNFWYQNIATGENPTLARLVESNNNYAIQGVK